MTSIRFFTVIFKFGELRRHTYLIIEVEAARDMNQRVPKGIEPVRV